MNVWKILLCVFYCGTFVHGKSQYVEPINSGLQMCVPYDIANVFIRPIAGAVSVFLSIALFCILFFGVITSPFGYMFGIPSRKYVLGSPSDPLTSQTAGRAFEDLDTNYNDFTNALFFLPQDTGKDCNLILICYAHGIFKKLPKSFLKTYRFFSQRLINSQDDIKHAAKHGLGGYKNCDKNYKQCPYSPFKLTIMTYSRLFN